MKYFPAQGPFFVATLALGVILFATTTVHAENTADSQASIEIVDSLTLEQDTPLDFGQFTAPDTDITVTLATDGGITGHDGNYLTGSASVGVFDLTGTEDREVRIESEITADFDSDEISLVSLTIADAATGEDGFVDLNGGAASFNVGGVVDIGADAANDEYTADYTLTATYE